MKKKTIILSQKQLDEICGGNSSYLDGIATKPDMGDIFSTEVSCDGDVDDGYADPTTTDDVSRDITNNWRGNAKLHGMGPITVREMTVKEWREKYLGEELEHGNERLKNVRFGAKDGSTGKSYDATKMALSRKRKAEEKLNNGSTPEEKMKAAKTLSTMKRNWDGIDNAEAQYNAAKSLDKSVQANKAPGTIRKKNNSIIPGGNGVFLNE